MSANLSVAPEVSTGRFYGAVTEKEKENEQY
jgi:hypothetical protein